MTNLEKIRQMSAEEMEFYINWICDNSNKCETCLMYEVFCKENNKERYSDRKRFADWLNMEANE